jgi:hypothetical protein
VSSPFYPGKSSLRRKGALFSSFNFQLTWSFHHPPHHAACRQEYAADPKSLVVVRYSLMLVVARHFHDVSTEQLATVMRMVSLRPRKGLSTLQPRHEMRCVCIITIAPAQADSPWLRHLLRGSKHTRTPCRRWNALKYCCCPDGKFHPEAARQVTCRNVCVAMAETVGIKTCRRMWPK